MVLTGSDSLCDGYASETGVASGGSTDSFEADESAQTAKFSVALQWYRGPVFANRSWNLVRRDRLPDDDLSPGLCSRREVDSPSCELSQVEYVHSVACVNHR